jgi:effector-binding domain-containing protein
MGLLLAIVTGDPGAQHFARKLSHEIAVFHQEEPQIEAEVCLEIDRADFESKLPHDGRVKVHELPGIETAAVVVYRGPLNGIGEGFKALISWIERQGYQINGPLR